MMMNADDDDASMKNEPKSDIIFFLSICLILVRISSAIG